MYIVYLEIDGKRHAILKTSSKVRASGLLGIAILTVERVVPDATAHAVLDEKFVTDIPMHQDAMCIRRKMEDMIDDDSSRFERVIDGDYTVMQ